MLYKNLFILEDFNEKFRDSPVKWYLWFWLGILFVKILNFCEDQIVKMHKETMENHLYERDAVQKY